MKRFVFGSFLFGALLLSSQKKHRQSMAVGKRERDIILMML